MSHEVYVWDIGVDSLKYIESVLLDILATIVNKIIDKEDYLMLLLTSELHLNQRAKFHEDFYCEFHPLKAANHLQSKNLHNNSDLKHLILQSIILVRPHR